MIQEDGGERRMG